MTRRIALFLTIFSLFSNLLIAEVVIDNDYGWSLDLPEGFTVSDQTEDGMSYLFSHEKIPVQLAMRLYKSGTYQTSEKALDSVVDKLPHSYCEGDIFTWRNTECALGMFSFQLENKKNEGWALSVLLPSTNAHLVLLCYSPEENSESCQAFIISTLNSLAIDRGSYYESGVITSFAFPKNDEQKIELSIGDKKIESAINEIDSAAQDFLINLEYNVLTLYANHPKWKEAWQRYYRMIYRDTYGRLKRTAFDIYNALYFDAEDKNINNASYEYANTLLKWTQKFNYVREKNNADFTSPIDAILGQGSDCDTRSLLLCVLLENSGIKSCLFVSREYGHAIFGLDVKNESEKENARIKVSEKNFLLGETTASVNLGLIAKDMSDTKKWIPVELY